MKALAGCLAALIPIASFAHEGHGETEGYTIIHYFTEPFHLALTAVVLAASVYLVTRIVRKSKKKEA